MTVNELRDYLAAEAARTAIAHPGKSDVYRAVAKLLDEMQYELAGEAEEDSDDSYQHERCEAARKVLHLMAVTSA